MELSCTDRPGQPALSVAGNSKFLAINNKTCRALWCKQRGQRGDLTSPAVGRRFVAYTAAMTLPAG